MAFLVQINEAYLRFLKAESEGFLNREGGSICCTLRIASNSYQLVQLFGVFSFYQISGLWSMKYE